MLEWGGRDSYTETRLSVGRVRVSVCVSVWVGGGAGMSRASEAAGAAQGLGGHSRTHLGALSRAGWHPWAALAGL